MEESLKNLCVQGWRESQWLRELASLPEELGLILCTLTSVYNSRLRGSDALFWPP